MKETLSYLILLITINSAFNIIVSKAISSKDKSLIEAGCKKKDWNENGAYLDKAENKTFNWVANGKLLEKGACLEAGYRSWVVPDKGLTRVHSTIKAPFLRTIGLRENLVAIDYILTLSWIDRRIKTNFSLESGMNETGMAIKVSQLNKIWKPDIYIFHRSSFLDPYGTRSTVSLKLYSLQNFNELLKMNLEQINAEKDSTVIEFESEYRSRIYCSFDYSMYPMDRHICTLKLGSRSSSSTLMLHTHDSDESIPIYSAAGFNIISTLFDGKINNGSNTIGVKMEMNRRLQSFILKYYAPATAIVTVSEISFLIPVAAIPGRIGLLVTLFLTLTNVFIHHMVSISIKICITSKIFFYCQIVYY